MVLRLLLMIARCEMVRLFTTALVSCSDNFEKLVNIGAHRRKISCIPFLLPLLFLLIQVHAQQTDSTLLISAARMAFLPFCVFY
jgi:hypothetical protein